MSVAASLASAITIRWHDRPHADLKAVGKGDCRGSRSDEIRVFGEFHRVTLRLRDAVPRLVFNVV